MVPDFRFALGAILAMTMLGITGFGLAMSVQLMHEARVGSFDASRSLAFADQAERNRFYDPDAARRFQAIEIKADDPGADAPVEPAEDASAAIARAAPVDRAASLSNSHIGDGQAADADSAPAVVGTSATDEPGDGPPDDPVEAIPDAPGRVASAPATPPPQQLDDGGPPARPIAGIVPLPPDPAKPVVHARPKRRHFALRARVVRPAPSTTYSDSGFPLTNGPWPGSDNQYDATPTGKKARTQLTGSLPGR